MQRTLQALRSHVDWPKQEPEFRPRTLVSFWLSAVFSVFESRNIVLSCDVGRWETLNTKPSHLPFVPLV